MNTLPTTLKACRMRSRSSSSSPAASQPCLLHGPGGPLIRTSDAATDYQVWQAGRWRYMSRSQQQQRQVRCVCFVPVLTAAADEHLLNEAGWTSAEIRTAAALDTPRSPQNVTRTLWFNVFTSQRKVRMFRTTHGPLDLMDSLRSGTTWKVTAERREKNFGCECQTQ